MLARYKKPGGFEQLLNLIETSNTKKQETFLKLIEQENKDVAGLIREKMISADKIFSWDQSFLMEIASQIPAKVLAVCLNGRTAEVIKKTTAAFTHIQRQEIQNMINEKKPNSGEVEAANTKLIQTVRELNKQKRILLKKVDPKLEIPENLKVA